MRRVFLLFVFGMALCLPAGAQEPAGSEFQVNTYTTGFQGHPAVASDANANFIVVWRSDGQDGDGYGIRWRKYSATGMSQASGRANTYTTGNQESPAVASDANGNFVIVWQSNRQDGSGGGIFGRRYDASGTPQGAEFQINGHTANYQALPAVASAAGGNFLVVWQSDLQDGSDYGVFGRVFDPAGNSIAGFRVNSYTTGLQGTPRVAWGGSGLFIVVWDSIGQDGDGEGVFGRFIDSSGGFLGSEFRINSYTTSNQASPAVAADGNGKFVVAWDQVGDGNIFGIFARRFNAAGVPQGGDFQVNTYTTSNQFSPSVAADEHGNFVVAWESYGEDASQFGVFGQRYDASGVPQGSEFQVNSHTPNQQRRAAVTSSPDGDFVVAWHSKAQDGSDYGVFGQRFGDLIFEDNFESGDTSRWSSSVTDGTDLDVTAGAALAGTAHGMRTLVNDTHSLYVQDDTPNAESRYRARFYFDPNGFDPGEADSHFRVRIFLAQDSSNARVVTIVLKRQGGQYSIEGLARLNDGTRADTGFLGITNAPHFVEFDWLKATGPGASDGYLALLIDNVTVSFLPGLDNDQVPVDQARLGVLSLKTGATGTLHFDQFESRRQRLIGPE
jgi:hypothetical protein